MKKQIIIYLGIFVSLAASRFIPHPPNFTSLLALSFYVPALLGIRFLPALIISLAITDLVIGYHYGTHWTWGSVIAIGLLSKYFLSSIYSRLLGVISGVFIFYIITNFGVWTSGMYGYNFSGLTSCYIMALPFLGHNIVATIVFSGLIEIVYKFSKLKFKKI